MLDKLPPQTADAIREVAAAWRSENPFRPIAGYIYIRDGGEYRVTNWTPHLDLADNCRPGTYVVDSEENILRSAHVGLILEWQTVAQTTVEAPLTSYPVTGGPVRAEVAAEMSIITQKLHASGEVQEVLSLSWLTDEERWLYLVKCPASWAYPKFVMGKVDAHFDRPEPLYRFGAESSARTVWIKENNGEHR